MPPSQSFCLSYGVIHAAWLIALDCVLPMQHKYRNRTLDWTTDITNITDQSLAYLWLMRASYFVFHMV